MAWGEFTGTCFVPSGLDLMIPIKLINNRISVSATGRIYSAYMSTRNINFASYRQFRITATIAAATGTCHGRAFLSLWTGICRGPLS